MSDNIGAPITGPPIGIGVWGGGGAGGLQPPPQLLGNSVFWAAAVLFLGSSNGGRGCFSIFRRADDVTRTMSKGGGGGCLWMSKSGGVFQFSGGRMTSRRQCPRGGGCACEIPPPFRKSCIRACYLCKIWGNQPLRPPNQSVPIRLCL